ncbi:MAG: thioredoxin family protein [gamma proteobacterium endosymbiont of Lamellibrachia anaximandri]|nr:thioredoxin family protein [gamma proteobacterium endosymbiont of Lamellibrachia anaximandri]
MNWPLLVILVLAAFLLLMPLLTHLSARRSVGKNVAASINGTNIPSSRLVYFYSAHCGPCRQMTPIIDEMAKNHETVIKYDARQAPETAAAYGIRATPTTVLVEDNVITEVLLGAKSQRQLEKLLQRII